MKNEDNRQAQTSTTLRIALSYALKSFDETLGPTLASCVSLGASLLHDLIEQGTLRLGNFELERTRLTTPIRTRERASTPRRSYQENVTSEGGEKKKERTTVSLAHIGQLTKRAAVPERDVDDTMMHERGQ